MRKAVYASIFIAGLLNGAEGTQYLRAAGKKKHNHTIPSVKPETISIDLPKIAGELSNLTNITLPSLNVTGNLSSINLALPNIAYPDIPLNLTSINVTLPNIAYPDIPLNLTNVTLPQLNVTGDFNLSSINAALPNLNISYPDIPLNLTAGVVSSVDIPLNLTVGNYSANILANVTGDFNVSPCNKTITGFENIAFDTLNATGLNVTGFENVTVDTVKGLFDVNTTGYENIALNTTGLIDAANLALGNISSYGVEDITLSAFNATEFNFTVAGNTTFNGTTINFNNTGLISAAGIDTTLLGGNTTFSENVAWNGTFDLNKTITDFNVTWNDSLIGNASELYPLDKDLTVLHYNTNLTAISFLAKHKHNPETVDLPTVSDALANLTNITLPQLNVTGDFNLSSINATLPNISISYPDIPLNLTVDIPLNLTTGDFNVAPCNKSVAGFENSTIDTVKGLFDSANLTLGNITSYGVENITLGALNATDFNFTIVDDIDEDDVLAGLDLPDLGLPDLSQYHP